MIRFFLWDKYFCWWKTEVSYLFFYPKAFTVEPVMLIGLNLGESQFLSHSNGCQRSPPSPGEKHKSGLPLRVLAYFTLSSHQQMDRLDVDGKNKVPPEREKNESLADIASLPTIFDRLHRIPRTTHLLQLCSRDVMSGGSVAFNYSHLGSIYASSARSFRTRREKNLCSGGFMRAVGWSPSFLLAPSFSFPTCSDSLYISFCMLVVLNYDIISF